MPEFIAFVELYRAYFSFISVALLSLFISLPKDLNPLSAIELIFQQIAKKVNLDSRSDSYKKMASLLSIALIFFPVFLIISQLYNVVFQPLILDFLILFILLSWHDKKIVYQQISQALVNKNLASAKYKLAQLTRRDTKPLSLMGINKASIESMVLQFSASWFAVIFWYLLTGIYGALFYRIVQICAQQWNSKQQEYDAIAVIPSVLYNILLFPIHLLVGFTFALYDRPLHNITSKFKQSTHWHHFSSGLMLASFAFSMKLGLGGVRIYGKQKITYPELGTGESPKIEHVALSLQRISLSAWFWLYCITGYTFFPLLLDLFRAQH
ncbi:adenosylcobinamide-phosphate synthase [Psychromonas sp. CNPT3]|uniref:cobalamin biosynthesis protein n=1 Tax=Psychromonas sp. CNPT3 TaxID=314282 RepID=UPI00006E7693|nr:cobalamin biosynthesis protein [Psychromonas sp. CNPT3]AGH81707.1 adenosylcobinamide-phosphate synthase [Psychromonas sp. CNPT3]